MLLLLCYEAREGAREALRRLLRASEADDSKERCWNWRAATLDLRGTLARRGRTYNGYPVSAGYFGSFCLDGLAIAMHAVASTDSFDAAIARCVNFLGDADSTGAIAGQIAGAMYGFRAIDPRFREQLHRWDDGEIALRAALLFTLDPAAH
jgi:ADP-ribosylglycohydrolase